MTDENSGVLSHYETLLAKNYLWMAGGWDASCARNRQFFSSRGIVPVQEGAAVDLGAGCGFQSVPLAEAGFHVTSVEFSRQMLAILANHTGDLPVQPIEGNILSFGLWAGRKPELITCMGDTLTHLPGLSAVGELIRHSARELAAGGKILITFRDYSWQPEGASEVIPVRRDPDRTFLCRLDYERDIVRVTDILYTRQSGVWTRSAGTYPKVRLAPEDLVSLLTGSGLVLQELSAESGMITVIAEKPLTRT